MTKSLKFPKPRQLNQTYFVSGIEIPLIIRNILLIISLFALSVHSFVRQMENNNSLVSVTDILFPSKI